MPKFHVLDHTGDTETEWSRDNPAQVAEAKKLFDVLVKEKRHIAYAPGANGESARHLREFDDDAETTIFSPALQGG